MKIYTSMPGIRSRRRMQGMSQQDAAAALGVTRPCWSSWERGRAMPSAGFLPALAILLRCEIGDLYQEGSNGEVAGQD